MPLRQDVLRLIITEEMRDAALAQLRDADDRYGISLADLVDDALIAALEAAPPEFFEHLTTSYGVSRRSRTWGAMEAIRDREAGL